MNHRGPFDDELVTAAIEYAESGWPVFPLRPRSKAPMIATAHPNDRSCRGECGTDGHGLYDATTDAARIAEWWARWPDANVALRTGVVFDVLDVDAADDPAEDGAAELGRLIGGDDVDLPPGPLALTPSGGLHLYVLPTGHGNSTRFRPGLDWRGVGGYVVAPPSIAATGTYRWWPDNEPSDIVTAPGWLSDLLARDRREVTPASRAPAPVREGTHTKYAEAALLDECRQVAAAVEHTRNDRLNVAALKLGQLVAIGAIDVTTVFSALLDAALRSGLGDRESRSTIKSGLQAGLENPRRVA